MLERIVSLVLIAAVTACPVNCGPGVCASGAQCATDPGCGEQAEFELPGMHQAAQCRCCCQRDSASRSSAPRSAEPSSDDDVPERVPAEPSCQGICGGAVFEKPRGLDGLADMGFLSPVDVDTQRVAITGDGAVPGPTDTCRAPTGNVGRFLRTLHSSFLC
jgi:hypothetical protein